MVEQRFNKIVLISALIILAVVILITSASVFFVEKKQYIPNISTSQNSPALVKNYAQILFVGDLMFDRGIRYYANQNGGNEFIFENLFVQSSK